MKSNYVEYSAAGNQRMSGFVDSGRDGQGEVPASPGRPPSARKIEQSIAYMMQHLDRPLQVSTLAATVNVSPSHFFALFKKWAGCPPIDYFIRLRMQRACRLLESTSLSVKEIAAKLGYDDAFYFSRIFKSVHAIPPRDYRVRKEESQNHTLPDPKPAKAPFPVAYLPSNLPRLVPAGENHIGERVLIGRFQPAAPRAKALPKSYRESLSQLDQTCSVSVHQ
jgi:AraC-like DNA-binding protein